MVDIRLESFRVSGDSRLVLTPQGTGVQQSDLTLGERFGGAASTHGGSFLHGSVAHQLENIDFKTEFARALFKAEGRDIAMAAFKSAGLPKNWLTNPAALSASTVSKVLDEAESFRMGVSQSNNREMASFVAGTGPQSLRGAFAAANPGGAWPANDATSPQLRQAFEREFKSDPMFARRNATPQDADRIAQAAFTKFYAAKAAQFQEAHPGFANYINRGHIAPPPNDARAMLNEFFDRLNGGVGDDHPLAVEAKPFRDLATEALVEVEGVAGLLRKMSYEPQGWTTLTQDLTSKIAALAQVEADLTLQQPASPEALDLQADLVAELRHQQALVVSKLAFVTDVATKDPLSAKAVAYSDLLWGQAAGHVIDKAVASITANPARGAADPAIAPLVQAQAQNLLALTNAYNAAATDQRVAEPTDDNKTTHPASLAREASRAFLKQELTTAGLPKSQVDSLTSGNAMKDARRVALNTNQTWAPYTRNMVVTKDGVTRTYQSKITPGADISPRFARRYADVNPLTAGGPLHPARAGISSAEKADHYHARNLKVSELTRVGANAAVTTMAKVIGHGVLDSWDIEDPTERAVANGRGAHEVLEAALATNDRMRDVALLRQQNNDNTPIGMTHVSVNLTTPAGWREFPGATLIPRLHDYQEQTYTEAQFAAFQANTSRHGNDPITFALDDVRPGGLLGQDVAVPVLVSTISFSFGINPIATGKMPDFMGGWDSVYQHNFTAMSRFVGDLGTQPEPGNEPVFSAPESRVQGRLPGGFIGVAMDRLDRGDPGEAALAGRMQRQTDTVRDLFLSDAFKRGNGDPAKMGREILALQGLAEEALAVTGADHAATMSKGCKSDKDRGGVTDVELKHKLITEDMGGRIVPDAELADEDQENYNVVAAASGQLENQAFNTGLPGSKEAGKLTRRIPDPEVRTYLKGLGALASE